MILNAEKAREIVNETENKTQTNIQEIDSFLYDYIRLGFCNCTLDIPMRVAGAMMQDLMNRGFKVFGTINSHKEICEIEVEW